MFEITNCMKFNSFMFNIFLPSNFSSNKYYNFFKDRLHDVHTFCLGKGKPAFVIKFPNKIKDITACYK